jgi:hypothetical protein
MIVEDAAIDRAASSTAAADGRPPGPYIGLKPYSEKERLLFFGRDADATRLVDKIFSSPLTLFYGPSGVGKSSLLLARVAPDLRDPKIGDAVVVTFDEWGEQDVETAIKRKISREIGPGTGGIDAKEPLAIWAGLANRVQRKPLVLILDQFEQFLLARTGRPDPLRSELAALVYADLDVHVVLSLREEFLAGLEVFAREIVSIYDSKFRLEHLSDEGTKEAIERPAREFGVSVEQPLLDTLVADLKKQDEAALTAGATAPGVELPFLQIVCKELWDSPERGETDSLSLDLYTRLGANPDKLGPRDKIIQRYVERLASTISLESQEEAAQILNFLAPRSRVKQSYDASLLSDLTQLHGERVVRVLEHFAKPYVLRERLIGGIGGSRSYELYHDAYIGVLRPWIDKRLAEKKEREEREARENEERGERQKKAAQRRLLVLASILGTVLVVFTGIVSSIYAQRQAEQDRREIGDIDLGIDRVGNLSQNKVERMQQRQRLEAAFVQSADATLQELEHASDKDVDKARNALKNRFTETPRGKQLPREAYIYEAPCMQAWAANVLPTAGKDRVATLYVHPDIARDEEVTDVLRCAWAEKATVLRKSKSPVILPRLVGIEPDYELHEDEVKLSFGEDSGDGDDSLKVQVPGTPHAAVVLADDLSRQLRQLLKNEHDETKLLPVDHVGELVFHDGKLVRDVDAWVLPHWAFPLVRAAELDPKPEGSVIVDAILERLFREQRLAFTTQIVDYVITRASLKAPSTVAEAERARGGREGIRNVLLELVARRKDQLDFVFANLTPILDALGRFPRKPQQAQEAQSAKSKVLQLPRDTSSSATKVTYTDAEAAENVLSDLKSVIPLSNVPVGRVVSSSAGDDQESLQKSIRRALSDLSPYDLAPAEVPQEILPVQVLIGKRLWSCLMDDRGELRSELEATRNQLRRGMQERFGAINDRNFLYITPRLDRSIGDDEFVIERAGERLEGISGHVDLRGDCRNDTIHAIGDRLELLRATWLSTDDVYDALDTLGSGEKAWLRGAYSLTDLKLLLRGVLAPDEADIRQGRFTAINDGRTVRDAPDLLASLVFWTKYCALSHDGAPDSDCLIKALRETQSRRFFPSDTLRPSSGRISRLVKKAVDKLGGAGDLSVESSVAKFTTAIRLSGQSARASFLWAFPSRALALWSQRLQEQCASLDPGSVTERAALDDNSRREIDWVLDATDTTGSADTARSLRLCRLRSYEPQKERNALMRDIDRLLASDQARSWQPEEANAAGVMTLKTYKRTLWSPDERLKTAERLLAQAMRTWGRPTGDKAKAEAAFAEVAGVCGETPGPRWCWSVLDRMLADFGKPNVMMLLNLSLDLIDNWNVADARRALNLLNTADKNLSVLQGSERERLTAWAQFARASAYVKVAASGDVQYLAKARELLSNLASTENVAVDGPRRTDVDLLRVQLARLAGDQEEVKDILTKDPAGDNTELEMERMWFLLAQGDLAKAQDLVKTSNMDDAGKTYCRGVLQFLSNAPAAESETTVKHLVELENPVADYMRLLLYLALKREGRDEAAHQELSKRWAEIAPNKEKWSERLRQGDTTAWQEMLIGYFLATDRFYQGDMTAWQEMVAGSFLAAVPRDQVFARITDPEWFAASPLAAADSRSGYLGDYFYDGQLQSVTGDSLTRRDRKIQSLRQAVASGGVLTNEYIMARYQLRESEGQP